MNNFKRIYKYLFHPSIKSVALVRRTISCYKKNNKFMGNMYKNRLIHKYGIHLGKHCKIGQDLKFPHPNGIIIGDDVVIGDNCTIYHQVTLGKRNGNLDNKNDYPVIGNNVTIFAGAKIIGNIKIGDNVIVAANSVVLKDVESDSICVGIPAINKKIKQKGENNE